MTTRAGIPYTSLEALAGLREDQVRNKGEQRGSVRRVGDHWKIDFCEWRQDDQGNVGYRRTSRVVGPATGKDALSKRQAERQGFELYVAPANSVSHIPQGVATVSTFVTMRFIPDHVDTLKKSTRIFYRSLLDNHVLPTLGGMEVRAVSTHVVQRLISAKLHAGLSAKTIKEIRTVISAVFRHARAMGFYQGVLPTESVRVPAAVIPDKRALTRVQVELLIDAAPLKYRALLRFLAETGTRIGEALGLRWRNVNLGEEWRDGIPPRAVLIAENWVLGERGSVKTARSRRVVPLSMAALVALGKLKNLGDDAPVFAGRRGQPLDRHNLSERVMKPAAAKAGVPWATFHTLRHTFATLMDPHLTVSERQSLMGHASAAMTGHYTHADLDRVREAMERDVQGRVM